VLVTPPPSRELRVVSGSVVQVELPLGQPQSLLAVPRDALIIRADGQSVYRVGADNKVTRVAVTPGVADGEWIAIEGALEGADSVVVRGGENLHDGALVKVVGRRTQWSEPASSVAPSAS
jgi:hypothetical protein